METDSMESSTRSSQNDEVHHNGGTFHFSSTKSHSSAAASPTVVTNIVGPTATSVYELLECPVCTCSMYPPIHQVILPNLLISKILIHDEMNDTILAGMIW